MSSAPTLTSRAWAGLMILALIWGFSFLAMRIALDEIGPFNVVFHRVLWAMLVLWGAVLLTRQRLPNAPAIWIAFLVMGLLNNIIPFGLIAWGQQYIETGLASIINASTAIWGVFVAALLLPDERLTRRKLAGVLIGFAGVVCAVGVNALRAFDITSLGQLAIVASSLSYALAGVWARKRLQGLSPVVAAAGMLTGSTLIALPLAVFAEGGIAFDLTARTWGALMYVSLIATALAYLLYYRVLAVAGSGNVMLVTLLLVPVAIIAGAVVLGETLQPSAYAGFALLALGLLVLDGRVWTKKALAKPAPRR